MSTTTENILVQDPRRRMMMEKGLKYEKGTFTASSRTVSVQHNLGTENVIGIARRRNPTETLGTAVEIAQVKLPPSLIHFVGGSLQLQGILLHGETRTSSDVASYNISSADNVVISPSFQFYARSGFPFSGTYDYILIALDKYASHSIPFVKRVMEMENTATTIPIKNPFISTGNLLGVIVNREVKYGTPARGRYSVMENITPSISGGAEIAKLKNCVGTSYSYASYYLKGVFTNNGSITSDYFNFGATGSTAPFDSGTYDVLLLQIPEL